MTDFGIARAWRPDNAQDTSGTPGYMGNSLLLKVLAPEVMCRQNHGIAVDYFAVGVMAFECMFGRVSSSNLMLAATLCWKVQKGNQRSHPLKADLD